MLKVAYVIASYGSCGGRISAKCHPPDTSTYMQLHMDQLRKLDHQNIDTIIMMKAECEPEEGYYDYDATGLPPVIERACPNLAHSYNQYLSCFEDFPDFDYYILVEDDYCLDNPNAISLLLEEHRQRLPAGGFLCSKILPDPIHAGISNGIIDRASIDLAREIHGDYAGMLHHVLTAPVERVGGLPISQVNFSTLFEGRLADIADRYSVPYWLSEILEYGRSHAPHIFIPIQGTVIDPTNGRRRS